ncbi:MAG: M56 family metallopeptidase [Acidimicrobiales bacterium]
MSVLLVIIGASFLAIPALLRDVGRAATPATWSRWCLCAGWFGVTTVEAGLVTTAGPTILKAAGVPALAAACERTLAPLQPGGPLTGWLAAAASVWLPGALLVGAGRARRTRRNAAVEPCVGRHQTRQGIDLVVVPSRDALAYSVSARGPQVVVSQELVDRLNPDQLDLVVRHELAHLQRGHQRHLTTAVALETALGPLARATTGELRLAVERAADEEAAGDDIDRRRHLRAALLFCAAQPAGALTTLSPASMVAARVGALTTAPVRPSITDRALLHAPAVLLAFAATGALTGWGEHISRVIAMAGRCPA